MAAVTDEGQARPIDAVVFDIGGVLLDWNPRHLYRKVFDDDEAMERFLGRCLHARLARPSRPRAPARPNPAPRLAAGHPEQADEIWAWADRSEEMVAGRLRRHRRDRAPS